MDDLQSLTDPEPLDVRPSEKAQLLAKHFELQLIESSIAALEVKDFIKSAMLSWSYIEEYFLPTFISYVAAKQKVELTGLLYENANAYQLVRYYFLITYDRELFDILEKARKLRNNMTHKIYEAKSMTEIELNAKKSAEFNLKTALRPIFDRQDGSLVIPALRIYFDARNDLRRELREKVKDLFGLK